MTPRNGSCGDRGMEGACGLRRIGDRVSKKRTTGGIDEIDESAGDRRGHQHRGARCLGAPAVSPPGPGNFTCPPGQTLRLLSASYTSTVLHDLTTGITANL